MTQLLSGFTLLFSYFFYLFILFLFFSSSDPMVLKIFMMRRTKKT